LNVRDAARGVYDKINKDRDFMLLQHKRNLHVSLLAAKLSSKAAFVSDILYISDGGAHTYRKSRMSTSVITFFSS
jgi:hypothetical protein